jgi:hypothetical protein
MGTVTTSGGSATESVVELATLAGGSDSVARGDAGVGSATVDGADDVCAGASGAATAVRGWRARARERCRRGSAEACGSFCTELETVPACV